ncbi:hypothetical protein PR048_007661 [Dryococelus australis]|uniref:Uncharacterized protein n=1 Tax=Dryococelus australis TaxID=614101 RepID=A0ABQ9HVR4_9NEOP|nr:hypothetical protein PR048_007661 [Dryococelus australis]
MDACQRASLHSDRLPEYRRPSCIRPPPPLVSSLLHNGYVSAPFKAACRVCVASRIGNSLDTCPHGQTNIQTSERCRVNIQGYLEKCRGGAGMKGRGRPEIPEKIRRPTASSGMIPTRENPATSPGVELGSLWRDASVLIVRPPWPPNTVGQYQLGSPLVDDRPIINAVKHWVVSGVVWTNRTTAISITGANRNGVLAVMDIDKLAPSRLAITAAESADLCRRSRYNLICRAVSQRGNASSPSAETAIYLRTGLRKLNAAINLESNTCVEADEGILKRRLKSFSKRNNLYAPTAAAIGTHPTLSRVPAFRMPAGGGISWKQNFRASEKCEGTVNGGLGVPRTVCLQSETDRSSRLSPKEACYFSSALSPSCRPYLQLFLCNTTTKVFAMAYIRNCSNNQLPPLNELFEQRTRFLPDLCDAEPGGTRQNLRSALQSKRVVRRSRDCEEVPSVGFWNVLLGCWREFSTPPFILFASNGSSAMSLEDNRWRSLPHLNPPLRSLVRRIGRRNSPVY